MILLYLAIFAVSLAVLVKSSDFFLEQVAKISKQFGISDFVIGMTLVALGTSLPELFSSLSASLSGVPEVGLGIVMGSNIANIGLVVGVCAYIAMLKIKTDIFKKEAVIMAIAALLLVIFSLDGSVSRLEGVSLLVLFVAYAMFILGFKPKPAWIKMEEFLFVKFRKLGRAEPSDYLSLEKFHAHVRARAKTLFKQKDTLKVSLMLIASSLLVYASARYLIGSTIEIIRFFNIPGSFIGFVVIAVGSSLPELSVSLSAVKKGLGDMVIGNVVGSNIVNVLLVMGVAATIKSVALSALELDILIPALILFTTLFLVFMRTEFKIKKIEGISLLVLYAVFLVVSIAALF
jgi:cation:H+ antiporter